MTKSVLTLMPPPECRRRVRAVFCEEDEEEEEKEEEDQGSSCLPAGNIGLGQTSDSGSPPEKENGEEGVKRQKLKELRARGRHRY